MAPLREAGGIEWHSVSQALGRRHVGFEVEHFDEQTRLNPLDTPTGAYSLVNLDAGIEPVLFGHRIGIDVTALNVGDTQYKSFLSRYKSFAFDPGRNVILQLTTIM